METVGTPYQARGCCSGVYFTCASFQGLHAKGHTA